MNYIVLDFEWNQTRGRELLLDNGRLLSGEIIEIGAVRLDEKQNITGSYKYLIKPVFYRRIHSRVRQLTGIDNEVLKRGVPFEVAFEKFLDFCRDDFVTVTWGNSDITVLKENLEAHGFDKWDVPNYDLQVIYKAQTNAPRQSVALNTAASDMNIFIPDNLHDALTDAMLTSSICRKLDMKRGIAEYKSPLTDPMDLDHIAFDAVRGIENTDKVRSDPRIRYTLCPVCKRPIQAQKITTVSKSKKMARISCPDHGDYFIHFRVSHEPSGSVTVHKFVYEMCPELEQFYEVHSEAAQDKHDRFVKRMKRKKEKKRRAAEKTDKTTTAEE